MSATVSPVKPAKETEGRTRTQLAPQWSVICHNDDVTTFDHVVRNFMANFEMTHPEAYARMLEVHHTGAAVCGVYAREVAEFRLERATAFARREGFPLAFSMEPEE